MFSKKRQLKAMKAADNEGPHDTADRAEIERFETLSGLVKDAVRHNDDGPPPFDEVWRAVERRAGEASITPDGWWKTIIGHRPIMALAPAGTLLLAAVLTALWLLRPDEVNNECFVDSYDVESGSVLVDQVFDDRLRPTVIWHMEDG